MALYIDRVVVAEHAAVCALAIDTDGMKHVLGLWEGATENAAVRRGLRINLVEKGLRADGIVPLMGG